MTTTQRKEILSRCWVPDKNYNFVADATHLKRKFNFEWLDMYKPWLVYSKKLKGAFCLFCALFAPKNTRGVVGSFIVRPFTRYKDIHSYCKAHAECQWHKNSTMAAKDLSNEEANVDIVMQTGHRKIIEENRKFLKSIISTIIFCGTHDLPLRGKKHNNGIFYDLLQMKIDSGDKDLKSHFENGAKNAQYTSPTIQNEIIHLCGVIIREKLVEDIKKSAAFSILADESADISGKEQLSIGVRFYDIQANTIREEFLGFVELEKMNAEIIATKINSFIHKLCFDENKCVGQGYDGCATMAGKEAGVQKILRGTFEKALYFHCASHKLNLVVNDLNHVPEVRNCVGTVKDIINFFRESTLRRNYAPNIPMLCETRWSQKYKSIALFKKHFVDIMDGLEKLSHDGNVGTRKSAFQLLSAAGHTTFILALCLIAKYSNILEPVANILQSKTLDVIKCADHIKDIKSIMKDHRQHVEDHCDQLLKSAEEIAKTLCIDLRLPRIVSRQQHRSNHPSASLQEYFRRSLYVPYLDSLITSLEARFGEENSPAFFLTLLHPSKLLNCDSELLKMRLAIVSDFYNLDGLQAEIEWWRLLWTNKSNSDVDLIELYKESALFYPQINKGVQILLALPYTTASIERSFSTLRRVKTWLRSTIMEDRLNGLCMLSVHRKLVDEMGDVFIDNILKRFSQDPRKLICI